MFLRNDGITGICEPLNVSARIFTLVFIMEQQVLLLAEPSFHSQISDSKIHP